MVSYRNNCIFALAFRESTKRWSIMSISVKTGYSCSVTTDYTVQSVNSSWDCCVSASASKWEWFLTPDALTYEWKNKLNSPLFSTRSWFVAQFWWHFFSFKYHRVWSSQRYAVITTNISTRTPLVLLNTQHSERSFRFIPAAVDIVNVNCNV